MIRLPDIGQTLYTFLEPMFEAEVTDRPNRFVVNVDDGTSEIRCHLHDPGRLKELIYPGNRVLCRASKGQKTSHSITAARYGNEWVLTDTRIHSAIASHFLPPTVRSEVSIGNHRMDFMFENTMIEVKGCTLMNGRTATFPDAPTIRGRQHLQVLRDHSVNGGKAILIVLVFRESAECFIPNRLTDPEFYEEFSRSHSAGMEILIPKFSFEDGSIVYRGVIGLCDEDSKIQNESDVPG